MTTQPTTQPNAPRWERVARDMLATVAKLDRVEGDDAINLIRTVIADIGTDGKLQEALLAKPESLIHTIRIARQSRLALGKALGQIWFVPRGQAGIVPMLGYKGLIELARRSARVLRMTAAVVYDDDAFEFEDGFDLLLRHRPAANPNPKRRIIGAYAAAIVDNGTAHGDRQAVWLPIADIHVRRDRGGYRPGKHSPWSTDEAAMCRKTALRALLTGGMVPLSADDLRVIYEEETAERETATPARTLTASALPPLDAAPGQPRALPEPAPVAETWEVADADPVHAVVTDEEVGDASDY
jgi:phage RecT family recombinase